MRTSRNPQPPAGGDICGRDGNPCLTPKKHLDIDNPHVALSMIYTHCHSVRFAVQQLHSPTPPTTFPGATKAPYEPPPAPPLRQVYFPTGAPTLQYAISATDCKRAVVMCSFALGLP